MIITKLSKRTDTMFLSAVSYLQNKTKQNKTKQNKTKQNKTKQNKQKQKQKQNITKKIKNKTLQFFYSLMLQLYS